MVPSCQITDLSTSITWTCRLAFREVALIEVCGCCAAFGKRRVLTDWRKYAIQLRFLPLTIGA
jgi:hypothetical protein